MYGTGTGVKGLVITGSGGAVAGGRLAQTGFPAVGLTLIAIALVVAGFALFRVAIRRSDVDA